MAQIFHPSLNTVSRVSIFGALFFAAGLAWVGAGVTRSPYVTQAGVAREQPVPFSHRHHVSGIGLDCRFCHTSVEESSFAGIPPTRTCLGCHSQVWASSPLLEPLRESQRLDRGIAWTRVHDLPDYVYFDHSIHVKKGIGCVTCHGRVDRMPLTWRDKSFQMEWCLECHRDPARFVRPRDDVFRLDRESPASPSARAELVRRYDVHPSTDCWTCHR